MMRAMEKVDKTTRISLDGDVNMRATVDTVLKKNNYADNLVASLSELAKRTDDASFNSALKDKQLPDMERITHSLLKVQEIMAAAHLLWPNKKTAGKITTGAVKIINQVCKRKFSFCNGKSLRCIMGGLFYLLGFRYDDPRKQREIAIVLQITDVSIRSSYKQWLKEFPDLFQDVIAKLSDQALQHNCYPIVRLQSQTALIGSRKVDDELGNQERLKTFDQILLKAIDETLLSLGETTKVSIYTYIEDVFKIRKQEIPHKLSDFSNALKQIFGLGSQYLEILFMKNLHSKIKVTFKWPTQPWPLLKWLVPEMTFQEYVCLLLQSFEAANDDKVEMEVLVK
jgi:hypothetical protein